MLDSYTLLGALAARTSTGAARHHGDRRHLPQPGAPGQDRDDARRHQRGPGHPRHRRRLVRRRARGLWASTSRRPGERLDRLEEALQICRAMFTEEAPSFDGTYYRIHEARNVPPPVQPGGPPILVGGGGEKRTLRPGGAVRRHVQHLRRSRHRRPQGRGPARPLRGRRPRPVRGHGQPAEHARAHRRRRRRRRRTKDFLRQVTGDEPTGSDVGTPDELVARVEELAAAGVEYFIFNMPTGTPDTVRRVGELLVARFPD